MIKRKTPSRYKKKTQAFKELSFRCREAGMSMASISTMLDVNISTLYYWSNPIYAERDRQYWKDNKEKLSARNRKWAANNKERMASYCLEYDKRNRELRNQKAKERAKNNPAYFAAYSASRRLRLQNVEPYVFVDGEWKETDQRLTLKAFGPFLLPEDELVEIQKFYDEAAMLTSTTGIRHEVDHIQPLSKGGMHLAINLQILTKSENVSKHNNFRIEDQELLAKRLFGLD